MERGRDTDKRQVGHHTEIHRHWGKHTNGEPKENYKEEIDYLFLSASKQKKKNTNKKMTRILQSRKETTSL